MIRILSFIFKDLTPILRKISEIWPKNYEKKSEIVAFFDSTTEFSPLVTYSGVVPEAEPFQNFEISGSCFKPLMNSILYRMIRH